jgi:hypothetical protein
MGLHESVKKTWIAVQEKYSVPVNVVGVEIPPENKALMKLWKAEGIDRHMK